MKTMITLFAHTNMRYKPFFVCYAPAAAAAAILSLWMVRITGMMGQAAVDAQGGEILGFLGLMTGIMVFRAIIAASAALVFRRYCAKAEFRFREHFAKHFLRMPFAAFERKNSGAMLSVYTTDLPQAVALVQVCASLVMDVVTVVATFAFMLGIHAPFTVAFFAAFPLLVFLQAKVAKPIGAYGKVRAEHRAAFNSIVNDSLHNTTTIVAYGLSGVMEKRYMKAYDGYFGATLNFVRAAMFLMLAGISATQLPKLILIAATATSVIGGGMSLAAFIAFNSFARSAQTWLSMLSQRLQNLRLGHVGAVRLIENTGEVLEDAPASRSGRELQDENALRKNTLITFDGVSFAYDAGEYALRDVSFSIQKGERVALMGESGSGKSTILKLMLGLYEPTEGKIYLHGQEAQNIGLMPPRNHFAYVPQDSFLFPESIGENISCVREGGSQADLEAACESAGILEFIRGLPGGFDTVLAQDAVNLSGGQRQRIAIARALYQDAPIILFDEATSALDPETEAGVLDMFAGQVGNRTVIMSAHRAAAVAACERIIRFEQGKIVSDEIVADERKCTQ